MNSTVMMYLKHPPAPSHLLIQTYEDPQSPQTNLRNNFGGTNSPKNSNQAFSQKIRQNIIQAINSKISGGGGVDGGNGDGDLKLKQHLSPKY